MKFKIKKVPLSIIVVVLLAVYLICIYVNNYRATKQEVFQDYYADLQEISTIFSEEVDYLIATARNKTDQLQSITELEKKETNSISLIYDVIIELVKLDQLSLNQTILDLGESKLDLSFMDRDSLSTILEMSSQNKSRLSASTEKPKKDSILVSSYQKRLQDLIIERNELKELIIQKRSYLAINKTGETNLDYYILHGVKVSKVSTLDSNLAYYNNGTIQFSLRVMMDHLKMKFELDKKILIIKRGNKIIWTSSLLEANAFDELERIPLPEENSEALEKLQFYNQEYSVFSLVKLLGSSDEIKLTVLVPKAALDTKINEKKGRSIFGLFTLLLILICFYPFLKLMLLGCYELVCSRDIRYAQLSILLLAAIVSVIGAEYLWGARKWSVDNKIKAHLGSKIETYFNANVEHVAVVLSLFRDCVDSVGYCENKIYVSSDDFTSLFLLKKDTVAGSLEMSNERILRSLNVMDSEGKEVLLLSSSKSPKLGNYSSRDYFTKVKDLESLTQIKPDQSTYLIDSLKTQLRNIIRSDSVEVPISSGTTTIESDYYLQSISSMVDGNDKYVLSTANKDKDLVMSCTFVLEKISDIELPTETNVLIFDTAGHIVFDSNKKRSKAKSVFERVEEKADFKSLLSKINKSRSISYNSFVIDRKETECVLLPSKTSVGMYNVLVCTTSGNKAVAMQKVLKRNLLLFLILAFIFYRWIESRKSDCIRLTFRKHLFRVNYLVSFPRLNVVYGLVVMVFVLFVSYLFFMINYEKTRQECIYYSGLDREYTVFHNLNDSTFHNLNDSTFHNLNDSTFHNLNDSTFHNHKDSTITTKDSMVNQSGLVSCVQTRTIESSDKPLGCHGFISKLGYFVHPLEWSNDDKETSSEKDESYTYKTIVPKFFDFFVLFLIVFLICMLTFFSRWLHRLFTISHLLSDSTSARFPIESVKEQLKTLEPGEEFLLRNIRCGNIISKDKESILSLHKKGLIVESSDGRASLNQNIPEEIWLYFDQIPKREYTSKTLGVDFQKHKSLLCGLGLILLVLIIQQFVDSIDLPTLGIFFSTVAGLGHALYRIGVLPSLGFTGKEEEEIDVE